MIPPCLYVCTVFATLPIVLNLSPSCVCMCICVCVCVCGVEVCIVHSPEVKIPLEFFACIAEVYGDDLDNLVGLYN